MSFSMAGFWRARRWCWAACSGCRVLHACELNQQQEFKMDLGIAGKWALVGGASKGLGWGCARALALEGVNVGMVARGAEVLQASVDKLKAESGGKVKVLAVATDITTVAGRDAIWNVAGGPGKDYDIVVTNAGGPPPGDFREWEDRKSVV